MRRPLIVFALVLAVGALLFPSSASATHDLLDFQSAVDAMHAVDPTLAPPPNDGRHDFVVGGARRTEPGEPQNVGVSAHSGPLGEDPFGHVSSTIIPDEEPAATNQVRFRVTCLRVAGNLAAIGGIQTNAASNDSPPGANFVLVVRDSGLPGGTGDGFQLLIGRTIAEECADFLPRAGGAPPIQHGNILVHDAMP
jgi:hypothetical protein